MPEMPVTIAGIRSVPAKLPLTCRAVDVLRALAALWQRDLLNMPERIRFGPANVDPSPLTGPVFGTSRNAALLVWKRVVKGENGFPDLRWHDLRHEAASRLFKKGLPDMDLSQCDSREHRVLG